MTTPKLAYCTQKGRVIDVASVDVGADEAITSETLEKYTRLGRRLRAEAVADVSAALRGGLARPFRSFGGYNSKRKTMGQLQALPDRMLKDIGIGRSDIPAVVEGFWAPGKRVNEYRVHETPVLREAVPETILKRAA